MINLNQNIQKIFSLADINLWRLASEPKPAFFMLFAEQELMYSDLLLKMGNAMGWAQDNTQWLLYTGSNLNENQLAQYQAGLCFGVNLNHEYQNIAQLPSLSILQNNPTAKKQAWSRMQSLR